VTSWILIKRFSIKASAHILFKLNWLGHTLNFVFVITEIISSAIGIIMFFILRRTENVITQQQEKNQSVEDKSKYVDLTTSTNGLSYTFGNSPTFLKEDQQTMLEE
jgi:hypothetical protein